MLKINNLINSRGEYEQASFNEPHLFTTLPALDEEKERPMIFYCARVNQTTLSIQGVNMSRHLLTSRTSLPPCPLWMKRKN
ncbi:hypothetical protein CKQ90_20640, partial [Klebsiella pneumoniae]